MIRNCNYITDDTAVTQVCLKRQGKILLREIAYAQLYWVSENDGVATLSVSSQQLTAEEGPPSDDRASIYFSTNIYTAVDII
jgi:hypothetical protein